MAQHFKQESDVATVGDADTRILVNVWKIAPGENARVWDECRDGNCITINWLNDWNFNEVDEADIRRELSKQKEGSRGTPLIWQFVKEIQVGDVVIANNGLSEVEGIGVVCSAYLPPDHPRNPRRRMKQHCHARLVEWVVKDRIDLHRKLFNRPTVELLDSEQCVVIKRAYRKQYPGLKEMVDTLFPDDSQCAQAEDIEEIANSREVSATTKKALIDARLGQGQFRKAVLKQWAHRCAVTSAETAKAIRASHIKPWRESKNDQRLDPNNGLPLIASLDALFDAGLISFEASGQMIVSSELSITERSIFGVVKSSLTKPPTPKMAAYLAYHRKKHGFKR